MKCCKDLEWPSEWELPRQTSTTVWPSIPPPARSWSRCARTNFHANLSNNQNNQYIIIACRKSFFKVQNLSAYTQYFFHFYGGTTAVFGRNGELIVVDINIRGGNCLLVEDKFLHIAIVESSFSQLNSHVESNNVLLRTS